MAWRTGGDGVGTLFQLEGVSGEGLGLAAARASHGHLGVGGLDVEAQGSRRHPEGGFGFGHAHGLAGDEALTHRPRPRRVLAQLDDMFARAEGLYLERPVGLDRAHGILIDEYLRAGGDALEGQMRGGRQRRHLEDDFLLFALGQHHGLLGHLLEALLGDPHVVLLGLAGIRNWPPREVCRRYLVPLR